MPGNAQKPFIAAAVLAIGFWSCGGRQVMPTKPAELNIPPELAKAFEVKELPVAASIAEAPVEPQAAPKKRKGKAVKTVSAAAGSEGIAGPGELSFAIPKRRPPFDPVWVGEKIWMDVTWLSTKAGEFLLEVQPFKVMNGRKVYDLKGTARTSDLFSLIYKAEDFVQSFVDYEGWFPYKFILHGDETRHVRDNLELFDHGAKKQYVHVHDYRVQQNELHEEKGVKDLTPLSQDSLSALYYVRTQHMEVGKVIKFPMTTNGSQWETNLTVMNREEVNTKMGYMNAFKTKLETRFKGVLQQQGDAFMWFSDDERKYPLRFEAKVRIGWVAGIAKKIEPGVPELGAEKKPRPGSPADDAVSAIQKSGKRRTWFRDLIRKN